MTITAAVVAAQSVPAQAAKSEPVACTAVNVTAVPPLKVPEQVVEQLTEKLVIVPLPVPASVTARVKVCTGATGCRKLPRYMWSYLLDYMHRVDSSS